MTQNYKLSQYLTDRQNFLRDENSVLAKKKGELIKLADMEKYSRDLEKTLIG